MKMRRFIADGTRRAMQQVEEVLGPDALILSNRRVADGVEIIAAVDYEDDLDAGSAIASERVEMATRCDNTAADTADETVQPATQAIESVPLAAPEPDPAIQEMQQEIRSLRRMLEVPLSQLVWNDLGRRQPHRAALLKRLGALGLHPVIANRIADQLPECENPEQGWQQALAILEGMLPVLDDELLTRGGVLALVGPTGVGKTTTVAKLAARFALRHGRRSLALVTMDNYRIGAHEQLRTYGKLLGVPVHVAGDRDELKTILNDVQDRKLVLIDTAGASQRDLRLAEQLATLDVDGITIRRCLVLSATGQMALHDEVIRSFSYIDPDSCILTKIDEATSLGGVLSVLMKNHLPVVYMSDGQRVPDDFHPANAQRLMTQATALMKCTEKAQSDEVWLQAFAATEAGTHAHAHT